MKIIRFLGGLGNQMFQYALYKAFEQMPEKVRADVDEFKTYKIQNFELEDAFNIRLKRASNFQLNLYDPRQRKWIYRKLRRLLNKKNAYKEESNFFTFDASLLQDKKDRLLWGYWQNVNYLIPIDAGLKEDFRFKEEFDEINKQMKLEIENTNSIALHVRRGDYINDPLLGGICDLNYYIKAIDMITLKVTNPMFFVFSNDIEWCKNNLPLPNAVYVSHNTGVKNYFDMALMSFCKHQIIANSTFSWWGAWLNNHEHKIVIAPKKWAHGINEEVEICPSNWIRL